MTGEPSGDRGDLTVRRPVGSPRSGSKARLRHLSHTARRASGRCLEPCFTVDLDVSTTRPSRGDPCSRPIDRIDEPHVLPHIDGQQVRLVRLTVVTCPVDTHDQSRDRVTPRGVVAPAEKPGHLLGGSSRILQQARAEKLGRSPLTKPLRAASTVDHTVQRCAGPIDARWRASTPARSNIESENQRERSDEARECDKHYPATAESHPRRPPTAKKSHHRAPALRTHSHGPQGGDDHPKKKEAPPEGGASCQDDAGHPPGMSRTITGR